MDEVEKPSLQVAHVTLMARLAHEIPKPRDWPAFQRNCELLFKAELRDPNAVEYGRSGQEQRGIDILGRRGGLGDHFVGVQCRLVEKPLRYTAILEDARAAATIKAGLKELIFATTAPNDTGATDDALAVEKLLKSEGHDLAITVYGWPALQDLIAVHDIAYAAFFPSIVSTSAPQTPAETVPVDTLAAQIAAQVVEQRRQTRLGLAPRESGRPALSDEDPVLHARIDTYRDLFKEHHQPLLAEKGLVALLPDPSLTHKPWALYRIETNLGAIALELGREAEGASRFETAHAIRPDDANALANLALARHIQGRFEEAMALAQAALTRNPRAEHAIAYLLQSAAWSNFSGTSESLIPPDLKGTEFADLGLAEFLRKRNDPTWADRSIELQCKHPTSDALRRAGALAVLAKVVESESHFAGAKASVSPSQLNGAADEMKAIAERCLTDGYSNKGDFAATLNNAALLLRLADRDLECEDLLTRGLPYASPEPSLLRMLALSQVECGRRAEALATLQNIPNDAEGQLLGAELISVDDPRRGLEHAAATDPAELEPKLAKLRWRVIAELALKVGDTARVSEAANGLRTLGDAVSAELFEIREGSRTRTLDKAGARTRLVALAVDGLHVVQLCRLGRVSGHRGASVRRPFAQNWSRSQYLRQRTSPT